MITALSKITDRLTDWQTGRLADWQTPNYLPLNHNQISIECKEKVFAQNIS